MGWKRGKHLPLPPKIFLQLYCNLQYYYLRKLFTVSLSEVCESMGDSDRFNTQCFMRPQIQSCFIDLSPGLLTVDFLLTFRHQKFSVAVTWFGWFEQ